MKTSVIDVIMSRRSVREFKLINPLDIPDWESKLDKLTPDERDFFTKLLESYYVKK